LFHSIDNQRYKDIILRMSFIKFFLFFVCWVFMSPIFSQEIEWLLEPIITDVDELTLNRWGDDPKDTIVMVKKDGKVGFKNFQNEIVVPIIYSGRAIIRDEGFLEIRPGVSKDLYFDYKGNRLEKEQTKEFVKNHLQAKKIKKLLKIAKYLEELGFKIDLIDEGKELLVLYPRNKVSITIEEFRHLNAYEDKTMWISRRAGVDFINSEGTLVERVVDGTMSPRQKTGIYQLRVKKKTAYLNSRFEYILPLEDRKVNYDYNSNYLYYISSNQEGIILDVAGKEFFKKDSVSRLFRLDDSPYWLINYKNGGMAVYDIEEDSLRTVDFQLNGSPADGLIRSVRKENKRGVYNFAKGQMVLPMIYDQLISFGRLFMATEYETDSTKFNRNQLSKIKNGKRKLYLDDGSLVLNDSIRSMKSFRGSGLLVDLYNKPNLLFSYEGEKIAYKQGESVEFVGKGQFVRFIKHGEEKIKLGKVALVKPLIKKEEYELYDDVVESTRYYRTDFFAVKKGGKFGIIDENGTVIVPMEMEEIKKTRNSGHFMIKYNGAWGVPRLPKKEFVFGQD